MKKLFVIFLLVLFACGMQDGGSGGGSGSNSKSSVETDSNIVCNKTLKVLPIDKPLVMRLQGISFGRKLYAVYPARVDPVTALENYTYDGKYYAENTHDYEKSIKHDVVETFNTITEMAKKGVVVAPQTLTAKFRATLTYYSANSDMLQVFVRAKGSNDAWEVISLEGIGTDSVFVETNEFGELEYYVEETSYFDWRDDEVEGTSVYGWVEANIKIDQVYLPFK